jgi:hypothetical protein
MRYYFHLRESGDYLVDPEGLELLDLQHVRHAAIASARSVMAGDVITGKLPLNAVVEVDDENGARVLDLPFRDAVHLDG